MRGNVETKSKKVVKIMLLILKVLKIYNNDMEDKNERNDHSVYVASFIYSIFFLIIYSMQGYSRQLMNIFWMKHVYKIIWLKVNRNIIANCIFLIVRTPFNLLKDHLD